MAGQESRLQHISEWGSDPMPVGEAEAFAKALMRESDECSGNTRMAVQGLGRMLDEALRRIDYLEARHQDCSAHVAPPPVPRNRIEELYEDRTRIRLR